MLATICVPSLVRARACACADVGVALCGVPIFGMPICDAWQANGRVRECVVCVKGGGVGSCGREVGIPDFLCTGCWVGRGSDSHKRGPTHSSNGGHVLHPGMYHAPTRVARSFSFRGAALCRRV